ncbi:hypothetical protein DYH09_23180 [bacterium CPR1]|nr:hypothetical protein [bacterium CPR1]
MDMRPLLAASLLGFSLFLSTGCGTPQSPETEAQNTPKPQETVAIQPDSAPTPAEVTPAEKPAQAPKPLARHAQAGITKDPFVNPFNGDKVRPVTSTERKKEPRVADADRASDSKVTGPATREAEVAEIEEPKFELRGIVRSDSGMKALLAVADETRIVSSGQTVDGYQVASIDNRGLTVTRSGQKFRVKMKNEFGL